MPLDIDGYNQAFKVFADWAQRRMNKGEAKAVVVTASVNKADGSTVTGIMKSTTDKVHKWSRGFEEWQVNNRTRALFKAAIIDIFGSESKIPESVKKAMLLADYDYGKPLTARRILAVKDAIDRDGTARARSARLKLETFSPEVEDAVLGMGYTKGELPKLARATHFYAQAKGVTEEEAMREVCTPGSKANRLASYGGRFMENAKNFAEGLRLLDLFAEWHDDLCKATETIYRSGVGIHGKRNYSTADTPSKHNSSIAAVKPETRAVMEKFVFEELAHNPAANLKEKNGEAIFGFKNNLASCFIGQNFGNSCLNTVGNIPPERRALVFKALFLFCQLAETADDHNKPAADRYLTVGTRVPMLARILRHLDEIAALDAKGSLTAKNVIKTCLPDMKTTGNYDAKAVNAFFSNLIVELDALTAPGEKYAGLGMQIQLKMEATGCTIKEACASLSGGKQIPNAPYVSAGQQKIEDFDTVEGARSSMEGDICRPQNYSSRGEGAHDLLDTKDPGFGFGFTFPGEIRFVTNQSEQGRANIPKVGDKVRELCGDVHPKQASSVMLMLSQSAHGQINKGLRQYGIESNEHSALDYTLTRNAETGAVTIRYSSPAGLPFRFEWTSTIDVDGKISSTPMVFQR